MDRIGPYKNNSYNPFLARAEQAAKAFDSDERLKPAVKLPENSQKLFAAKENPKTNNTATYDFGAAGIHQIGIA